jgi:hypothetical protein
MLSVDINFFRQKIIEAAKEHCLLFECILVAISLHIALIPILWVGSWALPWPKSPVITTIIEYELDKTTLRYKPKWLTDYRDPQLNR